MLLFFPIIVIVSFLLPFTPSGLGIRELSFMYLFSQYVDYQTSFAVSISYYFFCVLFPGLIGLIFLRTYFPKINIKKMKKKIKDISFFKKI